MKKAVLALAIFFIPFASASFAQDAKPLLLRQPTLSRTDIAFMYGNDLWKVSREGGDAIRLTAGPGIKRGPHFSPDGQWIAFTGEYAGKLNVYVIAATGGTPRRVTFHAGPDIVAGWTPDGKNILFASPRDSFANGTLALFTVPVAGGFPTKVPLPIGWEGSYSPDGKFLAYRPTAAPFGNWSHYRGGTSPRIWIANLADSSIVKLPHDDWNDLNPDLGRRHNLFPFRSQRRLHALRLRHKVQSGIANYSKIAACPLNPRTLGPARLSTNNSVRCTCTIFPLITRKPFRCISSRISWKSARISKKSSSRSTTPRFRRRASAPCSKPTAKFSLSRRKRATFATSRTLPASPTATRPGLLMENGLPIFLMSPANTRCTCARRTVWAKFAKSDLGIPPSFFYGLTWSPDSKKLAYTDKWLNLWYVDLDKPTPVKVDTDYYDGQGLNPAWSPDNRWIVYTKLLPSHFRAVFVHSLDAGKSTQITDGMSDSQFAVFDKNAKYIYFAASTNIGPAIGGLDMSTDGKAVTRSVYVVVLRKDLPSPLAPESDEEKPATDKKDADSSKDTAKSEPDKKDGDKKSDQDADSDKGKDKDKQPVKVTIDFDNLSQRILALPLPPRNYVALFAGKTGELFTLELPPASDTPGPPSLVLSKFDLSKRKSDQLVGGIQNAAVSFNGEKFLYQQGEGWFIAPTAQAAKLGDGALKLDAMEVWVEPRAEWKQMYDEIWRIERDFFYDPHHHGVNLQALAKEYEPYLDRIATRDDLNYLFQQMLSEINVGHMFVGGGDVPEVQPLQVGLLGADYSVENGRYRFTRVYNGENWNPQLHAPLTQPGVNVVAGEYLLAVNGRDVRAEEDVYSYFQETAGKQTVLKVGPHPDGSGSREVTVVPVPDETALRNRAWMEDNLRKVTELSGGKLAYVYLPNTGAGGFTNFNRYYFAQLGKQGAVIDERFNSGGQAADYIIQYMQRKIWNYWTAREGGDYSTPLSGIYGPKVMITNEFAGSGGDALPWYFRHVGLGPLIGKRTWGGLVGIGGYPSLLDNGFVTAPRFAFFTTEGNWEVENHGVAPDIDIEMEPAAWRQGHDTQLEKSIEVAMQELAKNPPQPIKRPAYPDYSKYSTAH